jgi:hypothetical protein
MDTAVFAPPSLLTPLGLSSPNQTNTSNLNKPTHLQFSGLITSCCLKKIVQEHDFEHAQEQIIENRKMERFYMNEFSNYVELWQPD